MYEMKSAMLYNTTGLLNANVFNWMFNVWVCLNKSIFLTQFFLRVVKITSTEELIEQVWFKKLDLVFANNPLNEYITMPQGKTWSPQTTLAKSHLKSQLKTSNYISQIVPDSTHMLFTTAFYWQHNDNSPCRKASSIKTFFPPKLMLWKEFLT